MQPQDVRLQAHCSVRPSRREKKHNVNRRQRKKSRRQRQGASLGGPWRAFLHHRYGGQFLTKRLLQQASGEYSAIKLAAGDDWKYYKEMGLMATLAGRAGHKVLKQEKPGPGYVVSRIAKAQGRQKQRLVNPGRNQVLGEPAC